MENITLYDYDYIITNSVETFEFIQQYFKPVDLLEIATKVLPFKFSLTTNNSNDNDWLFDFYHHIILKDNFYQPMASFSLLYPSEPLRFITLSELKQQTIRRKKFKKIIWNVKTKKL